MPIRDFRPEQATSHQGDRSDFAWLLGGALAAFVIGALAVFGWDQVPQLMRSVQTSGSQDAANALSFAKGVRLGEATMAPMLRLCVPKKVLEVRDDSDVDLATIYKVLHQAAGASRSHGTPGQKHADGDQGLAAASVWSEVADCVYRQNGPAFCDPHNRAFAIEAANTFIGAYGPELAASMSQHSDKSKGGGELLRLLDNRKERVLDILRARVRDGRLIADDFGHMTPPEIKALLQDITPTRNLCAEDRRLG